MLPMTGAVLQSKYSTAEDERALQGQKAKQQHYYNQHARDLSPIEAGDTVRMRLPGESTWSKGVCTCSILIVLTSHIIYCDVTPCHWYANWCSVI